MPIAKLTTGIRGFDMLTHGGIPEGRSTLVVGRSGAGKTIFGLQVSAHFASSDIPTLIVGVEESANDLLVTGDGLSLDLIALRDPGKLHIADLTPPGDGQTVVTGA